MSLRPALVYAGVALVACSIPALTAEPPPPARMPAPRPSFQVVASLDMSPDCRDATAAAVAYLRTIGAPIEVAWVESIHSSVSLEPRPGEVSVHTGLAHDNSSLADSYVWPTTEAQVEKAEIVLSVCSTFAVAHELSHVVGLQHQLDIEALLHPASSVGWGLMPSERP